VANGGPSARRVFAMIPELSPIGVIDDLREPVAEAEAPA